MAEYIQAKKKILRQFGVPMTTINAIDWAHMRSEIHCDQVCRTVIMKWLEESCA